MLRELFDGLLFFNKEMEDSEESPEEAVFESELKKQDLGDRKKPDTFKAELDLKKMPHSGRDDQNGVLVADTPGYPNAAAVF